MTTAGHPNQARLFDTSAGIANRDAAIQQVEEHASEDWLAHALGVVRQCCERLSVLATDDVWEAGLPSTRENRALGPVMKAAVSKGWCVPLHETRKSRCAWQNGRPLTLYRSLILPVAATVSVVGHEPALRGPGRRAMEES